jgi:hypothetical protein
VANPVHPAFRPWAVLRGVEFTTSDVANLRTPRGVGQEERPEIAEIRGREAPAEAPGEARRKVVNDFSRMVCQTVNAKSYGAPFPTKASYVSWTSPVRPLKTSRRDEERILATREADETSDRALAVERLRSTRWLGTIRFAGVSIACVLNSVVP